MNKQQKIQDLYFQAFGVTIQISCNDEKLLSKIKAVLPLVLAKKPKYFENARAEHFFKISKSAVPLTFTLIKNDEQEPQTFYDEQWFIDQLSSQIRITIAEFAKSKVFIHSGAVVWKKIGLIIPGQSYSGKTTLVSELIKLGAEYYSDEYAVIDEKGFLHPYPKMLSMRGIIDEYTQVDKSPEYFGAKIGNKAVPVKYVLITTFEKNAEWNPERLKAGEGILEILKHTIPIRHNPVFVLEVLKKIANDAVILKSSRGDAESTAKIIIEYLNRS